MLNIEHYSLLTSCVAIFSSEWGSHIHHRSTYLADKPNSQDSWSTCNLFHIIKTYGFCCEFISFYTNINSWMCIVQSRSILKFINPVQHILSMIKKKL